MRFGEFSLSNFTISNPVHIDLFSSRTLLWSHSLMKLFPVIRKLKRNSVLIFINKEAAVATFLLSNPEM